MRAAQPISCFGALCVVLGGLLGSPASAADLNSEAPVSLNTQPLPAVDGFNAKVSGFGGAADGQGLYGGAGSVSVPLGHRFGLQVDGVVAGFDSDFDGNATVVGTAAHLFWRDPSVGLLGLYGQYVHADVLGGVDVFAGAVQGALYLGRFTLEGLVGVEDGDGGSFNIDTRFFDVAQIAYYPTDNLKFSVRHSYMLGEHAALFGAEWGFDAGGGTMAALYARGGVFENGDGVALGGVRLYFGRRDKSLIQRHREDDPFTPVNAVSATHPIHIH